MRRVTATLTVLLGLGCASAASDPAPAADTRIAELQTSLTELLERMDVLNERLSRLEQAREDAGAPQSSAAPVPEPSARSAGGGAGAPPRTPPPAALRGADLAEQYRAAIVHYGARRVAEARAGFQKVFDTDPSSELADNALFWLGETYFNAGDFSNAISYYRRVSSDYGDQNKAPDAVYKLALAYEKSGDLALARQTLRDVIARYPYSTSAASARAQLERIRY